MITEELFDNLRKAEAEYAQAQDVYRARVDDLRNAQTSFDESEKLVFQAAEKVKIAKAELAKALDVIEPKPFVPVPTPKPLPTPVPSPIVNPIPVPQPARHDNTTFYMFVIAAILGFLIWSGTIDINNPFRPGPGPGPVPPPTPTPVVVTDPIRVSYIYDKDSPNESVRDIRNNVEKIESALDAIDAKYRAYDVQEQEVKDNYMDAVNRMNGQLPILILQNDKTGKQIGSIVKSPATADDVINAAKNARNGKHE